MVLVDAPPEVEALLERRRALGQDRFDEVWEGVYHMTPGPSGRHAYLDAQLAIVLAPLAEAAGLVGTTAFTLGLHEKDYRVPDGGYHRSIPEGTWVPTAAVVVEIVSPGDETFDKFPFYAAHDVDEIIVADPDARTIRIFGRGVTGYAETGASRVLGVDSGTITSSVNWPT